MLNVDVKKSFRKRGQLEFSLEVSFMAASGFTVIVGPSGAGKTTLLRLIAGILPPDEGLITLNNKTFYDSNHKINVPVQHRNVGYLFQQYALFPHLSAERNIAYGIKDRVRKSRNEKAGAMLSLFRIEHIRDRFPSEMSGGEQQRVALARALASDPSIVLLDEPLSAVDVETRLHLLDEIENAQRLADIPFLYVTHNESEADRLGPTRVTLNNGRTVTMA